MRDVTGLYVPMNEDEDSCMALRCIWTLGCEYMTLDHTSMDMSPRQLSLKDKGCILSGCHSVCNSQGKDKNQMSKHFDIEIAQEEGNLDIQYHSRKRGICMQDLYWLYNYLPYAMPIPQVYLWPNGLMDMRHIQLSYNAASSCSLYIRIASLRLGIESAIAIDLDLPALYDAVGETASVCLIATVVAKGGGATLGTSRRQRMRLGFGGVFVKQSDQ